MVRTHADVPIMTRISNFFLYIWSLIYLFFATIFSDPKTLAQ